MSTTAEALTLDGGPTLDSDITIDAGTVGTFSADQYAQAARNLLPPGRAWNHDGDDTTASLTGMRTGLSVEISSPSTGSAQSQFCDALGTIYGEQDADSVQMLADFFPASATQGIDEWNASLGLPDPCMGAPASLLANQQQIVARLISTGGQSVPYYEQIAAALGFQITITEFTPSEPGGDAPAGLIVNPADWAHIWRVNVQNFATSPPNALLQCLLERYKPAHTQFYIVNGSSPTSATHLFDTEDNVSDPLKITITTR